jgi:tetratricopeptide (TPR) repeat protein
MGMSNLALWLMEIGDYQSAEPLLRQSLILIQDSVGIEHPDYAGSLTMLANILVATNRYAEARDLAAQARAICIKAFPEDHWRTMIAASAEGAALAGLGQYAEAEKLLLRSHAILSTDEAALPVFVTETTRQLARLYQSWGKTEEAARYAALLADAEPSSNSVLPSSE